MSTPARSAIPRIGGLAYLLALILACAFVYAEREPEPERTAPSRAVPVVAGDLADGYPPGVPQIDWGSGED